MNFTYKYSKITLKKLTNPNKNPPITIVPKWYLNNLKALSGIGLKCSYPLSPYCQYQIDTTPDMIKLFPAIRIEKTQNIPNNKYMLISFWMRLNPIDPKALFSSGYPVEYNILVFIIIITSLVEWRKPTVLYSRRRISKAQPQYIDYNSQSQLQI